MYKILTIITCPVNLRVIVQKVGEPADFNSKFSGF
jgi:hypothetical protein